MKPILCECFDPGCPAHKGQSKCTNRAVTTVERIDMDTPAKLRMCERCAQDALESGVFD